MAYLHVAVPVRVVTPDLRTGDLPESLTNGSARALLVHSDLREDWTGMDER